MNRATHVRCHIINKRIELERLAKIRPVIISRHFIGSAGSRFPVLLAGHKRSHVRFSSNAESLKNQNYLKMEGSVIVKPVQA